MIAAKPELAAQAGSASLPKGRTPLAHLLHALNQPLTGLQCSLELASAGPRPTDVYVRTVKEGLELVSRMRVLVEAIRELADTPPSTGEELIDFRLETLLFDAVAELKPVAAANGVRVRILTRAALPVHADRGRLAVLLFRLLDSALGLARENSELKIVA